MTDLALPEAVPGLRLLATVDSQDFYEVAWVLQRPAGGGPLGFYCLPEDWPASPAGRMAGLYETIARQQRQIEEQHARLLAGAEALDHAQRARTTREEQMAQLQRRITELETQAAQVPAPVPVELDPQARQELDALRQQNTELTTRCVTAEQRASKAEQGLQAALARSEEALIARHEADLADLRRRLTETQAQLQQAQQQAQPVTRLAVPTHRCPHCERTFDSSHGLATHQRRMHPADTAPFRCPQCQNDAFARSLSSPERCIRCAEEEPQAAAV